ncbi:MAG: KH domain-containing protein [bacterium]|nr:KH domain-containing protein [bacterium]
MPEQERDAQFVETVAKMLVENPDSVEVNRTIDDLGVLITLKVAAEDMSTIIGREGRAAKSVRTLLRIIGAKSNERVNLKIVEPDGSDRAQTGEYGDRTEAPAAESTETATAEPTGAPAEPVETPAEQPAEAPAEESSTASNILDDIPEPLA